MGKINEDGIVSILISVLMTVIPSARWTKD